MKGSISHRTRISDVSLETSLAQTRKCVNIGTKSYVLSEKQFSEQPTNIHKSIVRHYPLRRLPTSSSSRLAYLSRQKHLTQRNLKPNFHSKTIVNTLSSTNATLRQGRRVTNKQKCQNEKIDVPKDVRSEKMSKQRSGCSNPVKSKSAQSKAETLARNSRKKSRLKANGIQGASRKNESNPSTVTSQPEDVIAPPKRKRGRPPKQKRKHLLKNTDENNEITDTGNQIDSSTNLAAEKESEKHVELLSNDSILSHDLQESQPKEKQREVGGRTVFDIIDETGNTLPQSVMKLAKSISKADSKIKTTMLPPICIPDSSTRGTSNPTSDTNPILQTCEQNKSSLNNEELLKVQNVTHSTKDLNDTRTFDSLAENDPVCLTPPGSNECMSTTSDECGPNTTEELSHGSRTIDVDKSIESSLTNHMPQVPELSNKENGPPL